MRKTLFFAGTVLLALPFLYSSLAVSAFGHENGSGQKLAGAMTKENTSSPLVRIAVPVEHNLRAIELNRSNPRFFVTISNSSSTPLTFWKDGNSWSFRNITFQITAIDGKPLAQPILLERPHDVAWGGNRIGAETLQPGDSLVREITLQIPETPGYKPPLEARNYQNLPMDMGTGRLHRVRMRALLDVPKDEDTSRYGVWTGHVESPEEEYEIELRG